MKNLKVRFRVATNNNVYYATSLKAAASFCKANDFVIIKEWNTNPSTPEKKAAIKCGRGVWGIPDNN